MDDTTYIKEQLEVQAELLSKIQESNSSLVKKMTDMQLHLRNMESAVIGDEDFGIDGLVKRVKSLEQHRKQMENYRAKLLGAAGLGGIIWTLILKFWDKIFN